jgi:hypothetical protein
MMAKPAAKAPPEQVEHYERLLATFPQLQRKGAQLPYTSLNGNMFTILGANGVMGLRLGAADREAFLQAHGGKLYEAYGIVMKEYVALPPPLLADTAAMAPWLAKSWTYAQTLRAKPTTRKKGAAG